MIPRLLLALPFLVYLPASAGAQTIATTVTFTMPVSLTQLSPDLSRVRMACAIMPNAVLINDRNLNLAISNFDFDVLPRDDLPVASGQLVATLRVVYPIDAGWLKGDPSRTISQYECRLQGFSAASQAWDVFSTTPKAPAFLLNPAPTPVKGTINW